MKIRTVLSLFILISAVTLDLYSTPARADDPDPRPAGFQPETEEEPADDDALPGWLSDVRIGAHALRISPDGEDAESFSQASWGGGLDLIVVPAAFRNWGAVQMGFEGVVFKSEQTTLTDPDTQVRTELSTSQDLVRFYIGGRLGHQGHGTFRPYIAGNAGVNWYSIHSTLTIPDDFDPENSITQDLGGNSDVGFGLDALVGLEINLRNIVFVDLNFGYMKNYYIEQRIAENAIEISPQYFVARAGITGSFAAILNMPDNMPDMPEDE
jgi:hypothetical protein